MTFWRSSKKSSDTKRDPAELSLGVWLNAFGYRQNHQSTIALVLSSLEQTRANVLAIQQNNPQKTTFDIHLKHGQHLMLECGALPAATVPQPVLQGIHWRLRLMAYQPNARPAGFARKRPLHKVLKSVRFRQWRDPRELSLNYWRAEISRNYGMRSSKERALSVTTSLKHGLGGSIKASSISTRLAESRESWMAADFDLQSQLLPVTRWEVLMHRLSRRTASEVINVEAFYGKLEEELLRTASVAETLPELGSNSLEFDVIMPRLSVLRRHLQSAPEYAALIVIGFIAKAINEQDSERLKAVLGVAANLALSSRFTQRLINLERADGPALFDENERFVLQLLLRGIGAIQTPLSDTAKDMLVLEDIAFLQTKQITNGRLSTLSPGDSLGKSDRWIFSGQVPIGLLTYAFGKQHPDVSVCGASNLATVSANQIARVSGTDSPVPVKHMTTQRVPIYGVREERLSALTASLSKRLIDALREIIGPHEAQAWLEALELPLDDLLFAATIDFWSVLSQIEEQPNTRHTIVLQDPNKVRAYLAGMKTLDPSLSVTVVAPQTDDTRSDKSSSFCRNLLLQAFGDSDHNHLDALHEATRKQLASDGKAMMDEQGTALLIGRNFDRNYSTDLMALGDELVKDRHVTFVPTAGRRGVKQVVGVLQTSLDAWHDTTNYHPAFELWSPLINGDQMIQQVALPTLIKQAQVNTPFDFEQTALLIYAAPQLNGLLGNRLFRYLRSGVTVSDFVINSAPRYMALMPGRDYIARVAALTGRTNGTPSFDVQTVFVGPRARYKATVADVQFTIETESKRLFQTYFGLPSEKVVLTGCAKVGNVQQAARNLDVIETRDVVQMRDKLFLVFACSPFLDKDRPILESLAQDLNSFPDARLGIRLHPTARPGYPEFVEELATRFPAVFVLDRLDLPQTLIAADILITRFSNVGLEAALLGISVIACSFDNAVVPIRLDKMGVSAIANSPQEMLNCIKDFLREGPIWQRLQETRNAYIADNPQLLEPISARTMYAQMEEMVAKDRG